MPRIRRIVHPTDFSPASSPAFKKALELAKDNGATLVLVHVLTTLPIVGDGFIAPATVDEMLRAQRAQADQGIGRLVKRARAAGVRAASVIVDTGSIADQIARVAKRQAADLIVMGTHGHGILARALLGSVAERVINRASCPVMTIKGR